MKKIIVFLLLFVVSLQAQDLKNPKLESTISPQYHGNFLLFVDTDRNIRPSKITLAEVEKLITENTEMKVKLKKQEKELNDLKKEIAEIKKLLKKTLLN
jgi:septal ring factor EnvC (AmiA/AmiB activator)